MRFSGLRFCLAFSVIIWIQSANAQNNINYRKEMADWDKSRVEFLRSASGWLNLEGLFWLHPGKNDFGSSTANDIVYNNPLFPKRAGTFQWENEKVNWISGPGIVIRVNDSIIGHKVIFEAGKPAPLLALGSFRWNIIKREDKIGVRFRNLTASQVVNFKGIKRYPVQEKWRLTAHLEKSVEKKLLITNVLGQTGPQDSPGKLVFTLSDKVYELETLLEDDQLFILFADLTSGKGTYASGRFLYAGLPDADGNTILDFNKAFNPPCAFSTYATCPLPPKQNILPIAITAGEKDYQPSVKK